MLIYMLSLPPNWQFYLSELSGRREGHGNGRAAVTAALAELQGAGYLKIDRLREAGRIVGTAWHVSDRPIFLENPCGTSSPPRADFLNEENLKSEKQRLHSKQGTYFYREAAAKPTTAAAARRKRGQQQVRHGVEVWTDADHDRVEGLVKKFGQEKVEEAAAGLAGRGGRLYPLPSQVEAELCTVSRREAAPPPPPKEETLSSPEVAEEKAKAALGKLFGRTS